jgi:putative transposase
MVPGTFFGRQVPVGGKMRKRREFVCGAVYHVTSRINNKMKIFDHDLGKKLMLMILKEAKEKFDFNLFNFCIMPNHIHLLIKANDGGNLSHIMCWIKTHFSKRWNGIHGETGHIWGNRYFARIINGSRDYLTVMDYIDQNPVKAGLISALGDWEESGAYHIRNNITTLVSFSESDHKHYLDQRLLLVSPKTSLNQRFMWCQAPS